MVGRIWEFAVDPARAAEFERFAGEWALPMVSGRMGCSAVHVLRDADGRYVWVTLWLSRKALLVAAASPEWEEAQRRFSAFGVAFDLDHGRAFESIASFRSGGGG
ncbi:MAG TPA: antibiotic biosynthesis monooxygenase [Thermoanaerobaculia bacterium]|jgi:heme-degrading monooxygenase HmoA|nr:antibiotic biosynthesis monooxygenase [Thermoanaerobaculia bacterium]